MGCVSSKMVLADLRQERKLLCGGGPTGAVVSGGKDDYPNHVVSLTSSTYGVLKLDHDDLKEEGRSVEERKVSPPLLIPGFQKKARMEEPEVINAWELMDDLDDDVPMYSPMKNAQAKPNGELKTFGNIMESPGKKQQKKKSPSGKENLHGVAMGRPGTDPASVLKPLDSSDNRPRAAPVMAVRFKSTPIKRKMQVSGRDPLFLESRRSFSPCPLFDLDLVASFEKELCDEEEQIKKVVLTAPRNLKSRDAALLLELFEEKCPPGGEEAVVLYTTTLRGIRRTFQDCNAVRAAIEAYGVQIVERDVSMDSGFREELRMLLMGRKEARVPVLFVRGRLVGGADEVLRLEDEGKLGVMLAGMPRAAGWCDGCGGIRFVLCMDCSGGRKVFDEVERKMVKCGECNENGLIHCPICC